MYRKKVREEIFKFLFSQDVKGEISNTDLQSFFDLPDAKLKKEDFDFVSEYILELTNKYDDLQKSIEDNMKGWKFQRIGSIERVLLVMAAYEMIERKIEYKIIINEVVEIAKKYGEEKTPDFLNGVLAKIVDNLGLIENS